MSDRATSKPTHCRLEHKLFSMFQNPLFRRSGTEPIAVMVVMLGDREAAMPLRSVQREFAIPDESADGQMLGLIAEALDYVTALRIGDALPLEVLTGSSSWEPSASHLRTAMARLQVQLVSWLRGSEGGDPIEIDADTLRQADSDPVLRQQIQVAFQRAAEELRLPSKEAVIAQVETLGRELAFIEALRDKFLPRVLSAAAKLERMARGHRGDAVQRESLNRVRYLCREAVGQINRRFEEQDAHAGEVMAALRNLDRHCEYIRANRDWLYRSQVAWEPVLREWDQASEVLDDLMRGLLSRTYQFLAPRFMPVTEWLKTAKSPPKADVGNRMQW